MLRVAPHMVQKDWRPPHDLVCVLVTFSHDSPDHPLDMTYGPETQQGVLRDLGDLGFELVTGYWVDGHGEFLILKRPYVPPERPAGRPPQEEFAEWMAEMERTHGRTGSEQGG